MITLIAAGIGVLIAVVIIVGIVDAAQESAWRKIAAERRERWEARQLLLHGADISSQLWRRDAYAHLDTYFVGTLASEPENSIPDTHATGMNDATDDVNEVLNIMGPPPEWSGWTNTPNNTTPAGVS